MTRKKKILLLGSSGYIGASINHKLNNYYNIIQSHRTKSPKDDFIYLDHNGCEELPKDIDLSIFAIGSTEQQNNSYSKSINSSINTLSHFLDRHSIDVPHSPIIYISTFQVYGKYEGSINEMTTPSPKNIYALVHLLAEKLVSHYCKSNNIKYSILRPSNILGSTVNEFPNRRDTLVPNCFIKEAFESKTITVKANSRIYRDFINIGFLADITDLIVKELLINKNVPNIINVSYGEVLEIISIANIVSKLVNEEINEEINVLTPNLKSNLKEENNSSSSLKVESNYLASRNLIKLTNSYKNGTNIAIKNLLQLYLKQKV